MKEITLRGLKGQPIATLPAIPVRIDVAGKRLSMALVHVNASWQIADWESGAKVLDLYGFYRGIQCGSGSLTVAEARREARAQFAAMVEKTGFDHFWNALATVRKRVAEAGE